MQVKCDQCATEYVIEEARVPEAGLKGKCTHCGHVFPLRRALGLDFDAVSKKLEKAAKATKWRIRKRGGEELEFTDLGTLRRWIVEKKVHSEDEISKTGDDWKPLGTIVELSKMFTSPEPLGPVSAAALKAKQKGDDGQSATKPSSSAPSPITEEPQRLEINSSDVLVAQSAPPKPLAPASKPAGPEPSVEAKGGVESESSGHPLSGLLLPASSEQLSVRDDLLSAKLPTPKSSSLIKAASLVNRDFRMPAPPQRVRSSAGEKPLPQTGSSDDLAHSSSGGTEDASTDDDAFSLRISDSLPGLQRRSLQIGTSPRPDGIPGLPLPAQPTQFGFQSEVAPYGVQSGGRGFLSGVVTAVAIVGIGYFVFDRFIEPRLSPSSAPVAESLKTADALGLLDRAGAAYARDTEDGRRVADQAYSRLLDLLPPGEERSALARRAHVGRARVALVRAEYARLDGLVATPYLERAATAIAAVQAAGTPDGMGPLIRADLHRLNGVDGPARKALEEAEVAGAPIAELAYVRATLDGERNPAVTLSRLDAATAATKALPRFAYYRAVTLQRLGRTAEAKTALGEILSTYPGHVGARRRLDSLSSPGGPTPSPQAPDTPSAPASVASGAESKQTPPPTPTPQTDGTGATEPDVKPKSDPSPEAVPRVATSVSSTASGDGVAKSDQTAPKVLARPRAPQPASPKKVTTGKRSKAPAKEQKSPSSKSKKAPKPGGGKAAGKKADGIGFDRLMSDANRLLENGRARQARSKFLAASRQRPASPEPWANLGWCELELKKTSKAITFFRKSLGRNPRYADALYGLGVAHERNKDIARARKAYQTYLAVNPRGSKARMVKRRLDRIQ